jgi:hypothetical protein
MPRTGREYTTTMATLDLFHNHFLLVRENGSTIANEINQKTIRKLQGSSKIRKRETR